MILGSGRVPPGRRRARGLWARVVVMDSHAGKGYGGRAVSTGPIEFMGESAAHEVPETEFGGGDGLIQPRKTDLLPAAPEAEGGHSIMSDDKQALSERVGVAARVAMAPLSLREQITGEPDTPDEMFDPHTGVALPPDWKVNGVGAALSDMKPK